MSDASPRQVELLVEGQWVIPMTGPGQMLNDGFVAVDDGRIQHVGSGPGERARFTAAATIGSPNSVIIPGLVNAHTHVGDQIYGTLVDEADLTDTLYEVIFPMAGTLDADILRASSRLGLWDALRSGVTTVCDLNKFAQATAEAAAEIGARALIAENVVGYDKRSPPRYDRAKRTYEMTFDEAEFGRMLELNLELIDCWSTHELITPVLGPHSPDHLTTDMLQEVARHAESLDVKMIPHLAATTAELAEIRGRGHEGSVRYLHEIGFLSDRVHAAHMVFLDDEEFDIARDNQISMSFNPVSMLASRCFPPIDRLQATGMSIGFGTDAFSMDLLKDLRYAIYTANLLTADPNYTLGAYDVMDMATAGGARALGLADQIGTLEAGKRADLVVLDFQDGQLAASTNPVESLAYLASSRDVTHTIVEGRVVCERGRLTRVDQAELAAEGRAATATWLQRSRHLLDRGNLLRRISSDLVV